MPASDLRLYRCHQKALRAALSHVVQAPQKSGISACSSTQSQVMKRGFEGGVVEGLGFGVCVLRGLLQTQQLRMGQVAKSRCFSVDPDSASEGWSVPKPQTKLKNIKLLTLNLKPRDPNVLVINSGTLSPKT